MDSLTNNHETTPTTTHDAGKERLVDIRHAARLTSTTPDSIRGKVERGSIRHVKVGNKRMIPVAELRRLGLLTTTSTTPEQPQTNTTTMPVVAPQALDVNALISRLMDQAAEAEVRARMASVQLLEMQSTAGEVDELRAALAAITDERNALQDELASAKHQRRKWFFNRRS